MMTFEALRRLVIACDRCDRLRSHCKHVAKAKRRAFLDCRYWGKPVPGFGDPKARLWIIGLAPGAHGANRTGRVFTGDRSGDFLYAALHRAGFANQPTSTSCDDGLRLSDCYISAAVRCAPPGNKPTPIEQANCCQYLDREWELLQNKRTILALGRIAWEASISLAKRQAVDFGSRPEFAHGALVTLNDSLQLLGSYHVSQQNTFTGKLTERMFDDVLKLCRIRG
jgi:uracil-DNA glycosylase family 4